MRKDMLRKLALAGLVVLTSTPALGAGSLATIEDFASDPATRGWRAFGDQTLFRWNSTNQNLEVTWDSSKSNSYYYLPIGQTLTSEGHDFRFAFDLRLQDVACGTTPGKPYTFELAVGLMNFAQATQPWFLRATGSNSPNLFEFDYFPEGGGLDATVAPTIISSNGEFASSFNHPMEVTTGDLYRITLTYDEGDGQLSVVMTRNGQVFGPIQRVSLGANFSGFSVDTLAICSYSDAGQDPEFSGSILAHGVIDNILLVPAFPGYVDAGLTAAMKNNRWQAQFDALGGWRYSLYRSPGDYTSTLVGTLDAAVSGRMTIVDTNAPSAPLMFYRLWIDRVP